MTSKKYYWHKRWSWCADGGVWHDSGLAFTLLSDGGCVLIESTLPVFHASELARGVPEWQHQTRLQTLTKEANKWATDPRNLKKK